MNNITNKSIWFWGFAALLLLNLATAASFFMFRGREKIQDNPPVIERIKEKAGLEQAQVDSLMVLRKSHRDRMVEFKDDLFALQMMLIEELGKETPDTFAAQKLKSEMLEIHSKMIDESMIFFGCSRNYCNPDQYRKMHGFYRDEFKRGPGGECRPNGRGRNFNRNN